MLTLTNLGYRYKRTSTDTLHQVNGSFHRGKVQVIIGSSGSGKSTLLSLMAGMDKPTQGKITVDGQDLSAMNLNHYRQSVISIIFQAFHLFPLLTVIENVCYTMEMLGIKHHEATSRAKELLLKVGIDEDKYERFPANLSGGEQQRVAIARALATDAKIILADEPTGNLDPDNTIKIMKLLQKLAKEEGYCVIIVTHDPEVAQLADCIYRMSCGQLSLA